MTFTYTVSSTPTDLTKIRFYTGDTVEDAAIHTDEEIAMILALEGTVQKAVIALLRSIITRLATEPDLTADWLRIDWRRSSDNWKMMLAERKREFGLGARASSGGQHAYRADSFQNESPDWDQLFANYNYDLDCWPNVP
ncbi:MAG: hypothetical protein K8L99_18200 [Anaerolineae bacterium]|nr:hypothetical protein [Anaerolineae bacterium]